MVVFWGRPHPRTRHLWPSADRHWRVLIYGEKQAMKQILTRLALTLPVVWLVVSLVFLLIHLVPGDPILQMLGEGAPVTAVQAARHAYGLDLPLGRQYLNYCRGVLHGDLGPSLRFNQSVAHLIAQRYPYTLQLTVAALVVAVLLSVPAGVRSA